MTEYWTSTKSPVHLFKREYESPEIAKHLVEYSFVDSTMLSMELGVNGLNPMAVEAYQRRLGVRKITGKERA